MGIHHLRHSFPTNEERESLKRKLHTTITCQLGLTPFSPLTDHHHVDQAKAGRFNQSNCAIALYSNAYSKKAMFPEDSAPLGYLYRQGRNLFSFGVYQRSDGWLFGSVLPISASLDSIADFSRIAMAGLPIAGIYVRFLRLPEYSRLVSEQYGFKPAKEEPWLPDAPEEDESLCHSKVNLATTISRDGKGFEYPPLKRSYNRGVNFLERFNLDYELVPLTMHNITAALNIIKSHFSMIESKGKLVGSSHFDYYGLLHPDIIGLDSVISYLGFLKDLPVSVFICESNGPKCVAGYAGITLRNIDYLSMGVGPREGEPDDKRAPEAEVLDMTGASAMPTYAMARLFLDLNSRGYRSFFMGGSENAEIDTWKQKQMGAEKDPTYWAILMQK